MTRVTGGNGNAEVVKLSGANWLGIIVTNIGSVAVAAFVAYGRLVELETTVKEHGRQLQVREQMDDTIRQEFLAEIRGLRSELRDKK